MLTLLLLVHPFLLLKRKIKFLFSWVQYYRLGESDYLLLLNRWGYVEGNPVNFVDPRGMFPSECWEVRNFSGCIKDWLSNWRTARILYSTFFSDCPDPLPGMIPVPNDENYLSYGRCSEFCKYFLKLMVGGKSICILGMACGRY